MSDSKIVTILVSFNNHDKTIACVESLKKITYHNNKIIIIDNNSNQETKDKLAKLTNIDQVIYNKDNYGFAKACNIGIKLSLKEYQPDFIWLLNNDTIASPKSLSHLVKTAQTEKFAITGSKILYKNSHKIQCYGGGRINFLLGKSCFITKPKQLNKLQYICGASMLIASSTFKKIGFFDEKFFLYWEDTDFSFRARKKGLRIGCSPKSLIEHDESSTTNKYKKVKYLENLKSLCYFLEKEGKERFLLLTLFLRISYYNLTFNKTGSSIAVNFFKQKFKRNQQMTYNSGT